MTGLRLQDRIYTDMMKKLGFVGFTRLSPRERSIVAHCALEAAHFVESERKAENGLRIGGIEVDPL